MLSLLLRARPTLRPHTIGGTVSGLGPPLGVQIALLGRGAVPLSTASQEAPTESPEKEGDKEGGEKPSGDALPTLEELEGPKKPRGSLIGRVLSCRMQKTIMVEVRRPKFHQPYGAWKDHIKKFMAHDGDEVCGVGDVVRIKPCRPYSKRKAYILHEILKKNPQLDFDVDENARTPPKYSE